MRGLLTISFALILSIGWSKTTGGQDTQTKAYTDANGLKQGYWTVLNSTKHLPGYSDQDKVEEGAYKDNLKQGLWLQYFPGGALKNKITFKDNRPEGYTVSYFASGKVCEEGIWKNNRWVGDYKLCYENGVVQHQFHYTDNGKRDGPQQYFYPNGQKMIDCNFSAGKQTGASTEYYDDGSVKAKENFNNGELDQSSSQTFPPKANSTPDNAAVEAAKDAPKPQVTQVKADEKPNIPQTPFNGQGYWKLYNKNKQIVKDGNFVNGHLADGKEYIYNDDGILKRIAVYRSSVYQGDAPITDDDKK
jgi:antitoxin component YwqK of YwqJK toxin-antitoxin module